MLAARIVLVPLCRPLLYIPLAASCNLQHTTKKLSSAAKRQQEWSALCGHHDQQSKGAAVYVAEKEWTISSEQYIQQSEKIVSILMPGSTQNLEPTISLRKQIRVDDSIGQGGKHRGAATESSLRIDNMRKISY